MSFNAIYQLGTDNVAPNAAIAVQSGTEDSGYLAANIAQATPNPAKPAKLTTTTGAWTFNYGVAQRVDIAAIIHHNLTAGLNVRIQGNATNAWGAPTLDAPFVIPAYREDGYPVNPWLDLTGVTGYSAAGFLWWRIVVVGVNAAAVAIGEVWLGQVKRSLNPNYSFQGDDIEERRIIDHGTDYDVHAIYDLGVTARELRSELDYTDAKRAEFETWVRSCQGRVKPHLFIPNGDVNDCRLVRFVDPAMTIRPETYDRNTIPFALRELGRGLLL